VAKTVYVPNLHKVLEDLADPSSPGGEFVLLRTRHADCTCTVGTIKGQSDSVDEANNLSDMVPVDQFDFTGATLPAVPGGAPGSIYTALHYARANDPAANPSGAWRFVYPGRYDGHKLSGRHQGATQVQFGPGLGEGAADADQHETFVPKVLIGAPDPAAHPNQGSFPIRLADFPPVSPRSASGNAYPFGLFARQADLLRIPFIGAYTVYAPATAIPVDGSLPSPRPPSGAGTQLYEMNGVSMDSAFAEDTDTTDDPSPAAAPEEMREQIGRFCPIHVVPVSSTDARVDDLAFSSGYPKAVRLESGDAGAQVYSPPETADKLTGPLYRARYHWALDLFDQFSIHAPNNDFLPNVAPSQYHTASGAPINPQPAPVSNSGGIAGNAEVSPLDPNDTANDYAEDLEPVEGLVNINTAPWKVLAALPMVLNADGSVNVARNIELAKAIVYFRDVHNGYQKDAADTKLYPNGAFASIFELNSVWDTRPAGPGLRDASKYSGRGRDYRFGNGYGTLGVTGNSDFAQQHEVLARISNLITTRSDSFTCYVYVMGVTHDGAPDAEIKVQRRGAFIADRSGVRPLRPVVRTFFFNNE
jgi:hypothetical protein